MKLFVVKHVRKAKAAYYSNYFKRYLDDGRKQWQMINQLLNRKPKCKRDISKLADDDGHTVTESRDIAEKFNEFFCNIAQKLKDESQPEGSNQYRDSTLNTSKRSNVVMPDIECTVEEIEKSIRKMKNKATSDLAIRPLKFVCTEIAPVVQHLVSCSLAQGIFPELLKCAKVIPLHKGGSRTKVTNYRPISLLPILSKFFEKVIFDSLYDYFITDNKFLNSCQSGFIKGDSCVNTSSLQSHA